MSEMIFIDGSWWVNEGITYHELFKNVILDCPRKLIGLDSLFLSGNLHKGREREALHRSWSWKHSFCLRGYLRKLTHIDDGINSYSSHPYISADSQDYLSHILDG